MSTSGNSSPYDDEMRYVESKLGLELPLAYKAFVKYGGLQDENVIHQVASPIELLDAKDYIVEKKCMPFATTMTGDLYCWQITPGIEWPVIFWLQGASTFRKDSENFSIWLSSSIR